MKPISACLILLVLLTPALPAAQEPEGPRLLNLKLQDLPLRDALRLARKHGEAPDPAGDASFDEIPVSLWVRGVPPGRYARILRDAAAGACPDLRELQGFERLTVGGRNLVAEAWERAEQGLFEADALTLDYYRHRRGLAELDLTAPAGGFGWLGVQLADKALEDKASLASEARRALEAWDGWGAFIRSVLPGSPAADSGLRPGDVVVRIDGFWVDSSCTLQRLVARAEPGEEVQLQVLREGQVRPEWAVIAQRP